METFNKYSSSLSAIIAAIAIVFSAIQYYQTSKVTREAQATKFMLEYMDLQISQGKKSEFPWNEAKSVMYAETIFRLMPSDKAWEETVKGLLIDHKEYLLDYKIPCDEFTTNFVRLAKSVVKSDAICRSTP